MIAKIMSIATKIIGWITLNSASFLGIAQAVIKLAKEIVTAIINILFPIIPSAKFQAIVNKAREIINKIDEVIEKIKTWLITKIIK